MRHSLACVPLVLCAAAAAQGDLPLLRLPAPSSTDFGASLSAGAGSANPRRFELDEPTLRFQDHDYSQYGLFQNAHGDFMQKRERWHPQVQIRGQYVPDTSVHSESGHFDLLRGSVDADIPWYVLGGDGYLLTGVVADIRNYHTTNMQPFQNENLWQLGVKLGFAYFLDNDVLLEASVTPSIFSDLDGTLNHKDYDYPGGFLFTQRVNNEFFAKYGVRYNEIYDKAKVLPWLGFSWLPMPEVRVDVLLPETIEASYWLDPSVGLLAGFEVQGAQYRVRNSKAQGEQEGDVKVQELIPYLGLMWRGSDSWALWGRLGMVAGGDSRFTDGTTGAHVLSGQLEPGLFVELGMGFSW
jgi:hypothetical protein